MPSSTTGLAHALANEQDVLAGWVPHQYSAGTVRSGLTSARELREQSREPIRLLRDQPSRELTERRYRLPASN